jgi:hypothetical protein
MSRSVPARMPAPWARASQRSSTVNSRLRARARIGPIAGRPGRREARATSPPTAAASQATVKGSARNCSVMSAGGALESRSAQPSTSPRAKAPYAPGVGNPPTATPPRTTNPTAESATLSPSSRRRQRANNTTADAPRTPIAAAVTKLQPDSALRKATAATIDIAATTPTATAT